MKVEISMFLSLIATRAWNTQTRYQQGDQTQYLAYCTAGISAIVSTRASNVEADESLEYKTLC